MVSRMDMKMTRYEGLSRDGKEELGTAARMSVQKGRPMVRWGYSKGTSTQGHGHLEERSHFRTARTGLEGSEGEEGQRGE